MVNSGSLAMIAWELGQARKGAAVLMDSCAEMWLEFATIILSLDAHPKNLRPFVLH